VTDVSQLGGGYADSLPDPEPTVQAVLQAARPGSPDAHLIVLAGPPGVGKSAAAARSVELLPNSLWLDKDATASGFVLQSARDRGLPASAAYGHEHYHRHLRPHEYAGSTAQACANLVGTRQVLLVGGWGPELAIDRLWTGLRQRITPSHFTVIHLDAPPLEEWRRRMAARGSRSDSPWFETFASKVTSQPIWEGAERVSTDRPLVEVVQAILDLLC